MSKQAEMEQADDEMDEAPVTVQTRFGAAPWWFISMAFHGLMIALVSLVTMTIGEIKAEGVIVITASLEKHRVLEPQKKPELEPNPNRKPAENDNEGIDETSPVSSPVIVPKDVLDQVEVGSHWETFNPELPDLQSARGVEEARIFYDKHGVVDDAGGGGNYGIFLDEVIGAGGNSSPGTGGGLFGGNGTGYGPGDGSGKGTWGTRNGSGRRWMVMRNCGSTKSENHVNAALSWLAKHQEVDGHWDCVKYGGKQADVAITGLSLLAVLGAGHTEKVGEFKDNVKRAVYWLISIQNEDGKYYKTGETHGVGYHHAIAGLAMAEAAGMGRVGETVKSAQKGIDYSIEKHQQGEGSERKGWRYAPKSPTADISVTGWFIMQLKSAKVAKLKVDTAGFDGAIRFLDSVEQKGAAGDPYGGHRYGYTDAQSVGHRRCAIGCLGRQFLGWKREDLQGGVEHFVNQGGTPKWDGNGGNVVLYYWYYGTMCVYQQGGDTWKRWNQDMLKALCENQRKGGDEHGSWDPVGSYSEYWGRVGQTALGVLCLEVYYRYLPLYR